ncbi:MAG: radical SAM protein [Candidatus Omnitrophica bacterium]|nr:radical SAM protein [Candidatus Omnitrophota bacterium]
MQNFFIDYLAKYNLGPTKYRRWIPLDFLNAISILRRQGIPAKLISGKEALGIAVKGGLNFFISSSHLDIWQCPPLDISPGFYELCRKLAQNNNLFVSGFHGTLLPEIMLAKTSAKAIIRSEPEAVMEEISKARPFDQIKGITYRNHDKIVSNPDQGFLDLKKIPVPAYDQVDFRLYRYGLTGWDNFAIFETSRGCKFNCEFCSKDVMYGRQYRIKDPEQAKREIETAILDHKARSGYFFDLDFLSNKETVEELCNFLAKRKYDFKWCCQTKIDEVDAGLLKLMRQAGCRLVHYGIETYSDINGNRKYKSFSLEKAKKVIQETESLGIYSLCFYIIGFNGHLSPGEDRKTLRMMHEIDSRYISLHRYYNYRDKDLMQRGLGGFKRRKIDKIGITILMSLLLYYFSPKRIIKYLSEDAGRGFLPRLKYFLAAIWQS